MRTMLFYQGEANVANGFSTQDPTWYACAASALVADYREKIPGLSTFGAFQLAGCACYPGLVNLSDIRAAQAAPLLTTPRFAFATAADAANASDPTNIHFPVKQGISQRMAVQVLALEYGLQPSGGPTALPQLSGAEQVAGGGELILHVSLSGCSGSGCQLRDAQCPVADARQCSGFQVRVNGAGSNDTATWLTAQPTVLVDGRTVELRVPGAGGGALASAVSYGRANWPLMTLYAQGSGLPVLPFCVALGRALTQQCYEAGI